MFYKQERFGVSIGVCEGITPTMLLCHYDRFYLDW